MADLSSYIYIAANTVTAAGNIVADNLVGNTIIANSELSGDGGNLGNITGANVSGVVANANFASYANIATTANSVAAANISGTVNLANYATTANSVAGANVSGQVSYAGTANSVAAANIIGTVNLANYATTANSVAAGNITGTVANATYAVTAGTANSVAGANVSGTVANATYATSAGTATTAGTVTTAAQPNITSVGTLSSVIVTANANVGNLTSTGRVYATDNLLVGSTGGEGGQITIGYAGTNGFNGQVNSTWNIDVDGSNNYRVFYQNASGGTGEAIKAYSSNATVLFGANIVVSGNANVQGTLTYNNLTNLTTSNLVLGLGNNQTGVSVNGAGIVAGNTAEASFLYNYSSQTWNSNIGLSAVGNVTGSYIIGNGSQLTSLTGANVTGAVSYATTANSVAVANVSGIGNIATINKDGNASNILYGNGSFASAPVTYGNSNVATFLGSYGSNTITTTGNVSVGNIIGNGQALSGITGANVTGQVNYSATANAVAGANVSGAVAYATTANAVAGANVSGQVGNALVASTVYTNAQPNITSVGTLTSLAVTGNITNGNITGGNLVSANYFTGTLTTAAQPNITSTGTLTALTVTGNITGANLIAGSSGTGNVYAGNVIVNGQPTTYGVANLTTGVVAIQATATGTVSATVVANTSPVETSVNGGSSTSPALTVLTLAIPSAGTWRLDAELRVYVPGQGYMSAAFYDNGTLISGSEYFVAAGGVTQSGAATGQYSGFMSYNLTTTGARTVTLGIWSTTSSNCITSADGRTWLRATQIDSIFALNTLATMSVTGNVTVGGNLSVTGGIRKSARLITSATTLTVADAGGFLEITGGPFTIALPDATVAANSGIGYRFWLNTTSNITLTCPTGAFYGPGGNATNTVVIAYTTTLYWDIWSDGYNWIIFPIKIA